MSLLKAAGQKLAESAARRLKAYHGSPHDFDEFSTEAIGTGEGAQAYGHGLYFAEREGTAKSYRDALTEPRFTFDGKPADAIYTNEIRERWADVYDELIDDELVQDWKLSYLDSVAENGGDYDKASEALDSLVEKVLKGEETTYDFDKLDEFGSDVDPNGIYDLNEPQQHLDSVLANMSQADSPSTMDIVLSGLSPEELRIYERYVEPRVEYIKPEGSMYEVDINASPDELLDWDKPINEQSPQVQKALSEMGKSDSYRERIYNQAINSGNGHTYRGYGIHEYDGKYYLYENDQIVANAENTDDLIFNNRRDAEKELKTLIDNNQDATSTGAQVYRSLVETNGMDGIGQQIASDALKEKGIKGIKYADAQTRFSSKGKTSNYVIFDDKLLAIARKYGVTMPVAGAILAGTMTPDQAQAGVVTKAARELMLKYFDEAEVDNAIRQAGSRKSREALTQMPIDDFLALAREGYSPAKAAGISDVSKFDDLPFLNIRSEDGIANITGHEGRHRARRLKELGESTMPVRIKSDIRWDQQNDPNLWDYEQDYPEILFNEDGTKKSPFPFVQGDSNVLDSSALNIEDIPRKTTPTSTSKQIDDDELLKSLFGGSAATVVGAGALFAPKNLQAAEYNEAPVIEEQSFGDMVNEYGQINRNLKALDDQRFARLMDEEKKLRAMGSASFGKVSPELAAYRRSQLIPSVGTLAQGAVRDTAKGLDYLSPANLTRLLLDPADEGLSRFMAKPISDRIAKGAEVVTQPMLFDEDDPYSKKRKEKTMDIGGMLFSPL